MYTFITLALPTVLLASIAGSAPTSRLEKVLNEVAEPTVVTPVEEVAVVEPEVSCVGCNENEIETLEYLWEYGIKDKAALATIMGNIKQESNFNANICEGGARVAYSRCYSGGYGIIQWTTPNRYYGLGKFAKRYGGDPSTIGTQLRYMVEEVQWKRAANTFKTPGLSVGSYMNAAYGWLGWGIHGNRTYYSNQYLNKVQIN
jgi:hypothetical protein